MLAVDRVSPGCIDETVVPFFGQMSGDMSFQVWSGTAGLDVTGSRKQKSTEASDVDACRTLGVDSELVKDRRCHGILVLSL